MLSLRNAEGPRSRLLGEWSQPCAPFVVYSVGRSNSVTVHSQCEGDCLCLYHHPQRSSRPITLTSLPTCDDTLVFAVMPSRHYPPAVSDDVMLALFHSPHVHLKAAQVVRLLEFKRSKRRIVCAQLRRLAQTGRLVEHLTLSTRYTQPLYSLPVAPAPPDTSPAINLQCLCCQAAPPTVVCLPCRHQRCCAECWQRIVQRERSVFNVQQRLKRQLATAQNQRLPFKPRCPVCRGEVEGVIETYMD